MSSLFQAIYGLICKTENACPIPSSIPNGKYVKFLKTFKFKFMLQKNENVKLDLLQ